MAAWGYDFTFECWKYLSRVSEANLWEIHSHVKDKNRLIKMFFVGFMSIKFFHHSTKLDICHAQAAQAPAVRWSSYATTVKAELLDRFLWWKEPILTSCPFRGFSYVRITPRNGQLTKMVSFHQSKRSDNKWYTVEVSWGIFIENLA